MLVTKAEIMEEFKSIIDELDQFIDEQDDDNMAGPTGLAMMDMLIDRGNDAGDNRNFARAIAYFLHQKVIALHVTGEIDKPADITMERVNEIIEEVISSRFKQREEVTMH